MLLCLHCSVSELARLETAKEVFAAVTAMTGVDSLEQFMQRFQDAEEKNYSIFRRVDELATESEAIRAQICAVRAFVPVLLCVCWSWRATDTPFQAAGSHATAHAARHTLPSSQQLLTHSRC